MDSEEYIWEWENIRRAFVEEDTRLNPEKRCIARGCRGGPLDPPFRQFGGMVTS